MQNIDIKQENTAQSIADKKELEKQIQQTAEEKQNCFDPKCI